MDEETAADTDKEVAEGDLILIDYTGRISSTGEIFDLTDEEKARSENVFEEEADYGSVPVLVGRNYIVEGLEEKLVGRKIGDKATIEVAAENAFGRRSSDQIRTISESQFRESDVRAYPGSLIRVGSKQGKVIAKSSGRVKVDFNHPLAGKDLEYEVEIQRRLQAVEDKINEVVGYYLNECLSISVEEGTAEAEVSPDPQEIPEELLSEIKSDIKFACSNIDEVELVAEDEESAAEDEKQ